MKIVIDKYIPYLDGILEPYADVVYATPAEITPALVKDADALLVRTRTRIDADLLQDSVCRFVATATIGMDHFNLPWCRSAGVEAVNAPGCNAPAVAQYVFASISRLIDCDPAELTLAVVGVGHVGGIVARWARGMGFRVMLVDPPRADAEGGDGWSTLADAAREADIITFHTPLIKDGVHPTFHLADKHFFDSLARKPIVINSSRGPVVDNTEWLQAIRDGRVSRSVVDVWEGEPFINSDLLKAADIATPHIAGYSMDGKIRASEMVLDALTARFGLPHLRPGVRPACAVPETVSLQSVADSYDPTADTAAMREAIGTSDSPAATFEHLRDSYELRPEVIPPYNS